MPKHVPCRRVLRIYIVMTRTFIPYFWLYWYLMRPIRKKIGQDTFNEEEFKDNY